jgi:hypothetical protein
MGRHGAGGTATRRARISVPLVMIGVLVVAAIGFGIWLWSLKSVTDPIDAKPVDAYAVVLSSPSCTSGAGTTVIDLNLTPVVRSSLSACGRRVGEQVAVQYLDGHPDQARLAGTTIAHNSPAGRWLPIAIVAAGLLALIATIALLVERRQSRHAGTATRVTVAQLQAGGVVGRAPVSAWLGSGGAVPVPAASVTPMTDQVAPSAQMAGDVLGDNPDATARIAVPGSAGPAAQPFRPSQISVDGDLFTHRGPEAPDR